MSERDMRIKVINRAAPGGFIYLLTFIGAAVYFEQHALGFWDVIVGLLQALVWPAFFIFHALTLLGA